MKFTSMNPRTRMGKLKIMWVMKVILMTSSSDMRRWEIFDILTVVLWIWATLDMARVFSWKSWTLDPTGNSKLDRPSQSFI